MMNKLKSLKAIGPKIVVKVTKVDEKTEGGLFLIKDHVAREQNAVSEGEIVDLGPTAYDWMDQEDAPKIGEHVFFVKYAGIGKTINDEEYRIINDEDIYAIGVMSDE